MKWSFRIGEFHGTQVRVHATFFVLPAWIGLAFYAEGGPMAALAAVLFILLLFLCVVLHEFGHATAARRYGIRTPDITLFPIGGVARLERIPRNPGHEFIIAIAGPLVNVVIAGILVLLVGMPDSLWATDLGNLSMIPMNLLKINITLVVFNLVPAFPMDGGRMLRALLATFLGHTRATNVAANLGQLLAIVAGLAGLLHGQIFLTLIAIFIFMGAGQEAAMTRMREATSGLSVSDAMITDFRTLSDTATLNDAVDALIAGSQHDFPVLDKIGTLAGVLVRHDLITALAKHGASRPASEFMRTRPESVLVDCSLEHALERLSTTQCPTLPVMTKDGKTLAGLLTAENVGEMMMVQTALATRRAHGQNSLSPSQPSATIPRPL